MSKTYTAGWRYYFFLILFTATSLVGARALYMLFAGQVSFGDDLTVGENKFLCIFAAVVLFLPLMSYARSSYYLWRQLIKYKGAVITLTDMGIENTLVFTWLFAFVFIRPVKLIPWETVKYYDENDGHPYVRLRTKEVQAGWTARLILRLWGYMFLHSFVKPHVSAEDVCAYEQRFSLEDGWKIL